MDFLLVGIGGFFGAICRFGIHLLEKNWKLTHFPLGTLIINLLGCFLAGLLMGIIQDKGQAFRELHLLLMVGFLGAFTTFSAFSMESLGLMKEGLVGQGLLHIALNVGLGLLAVFTGQQLSYLLK